MREIAKVRETEPQREIMYMDETWLNEGHRLQKEWVDLVTLNKANRKLLYNEGLRLQLHGAIYRPDPFVLMQRYCANLKAIILASMSLKRIVAEKPHRVIVA